MLIKKQPAPRKPRLFGELKPGDTFRRAGSSEVMLVIPEVTYPVDDDTKYSAMMIASEDRTIDPSHFYDVFWCLSANSPIVLLNAHIVVEDPIEMEE